MSHHEATQCQGDSVRYLRCVQKKEMGNKKMRICRRARAEKDESWTVKKAEHRRIDAFELWCWRRLLRVPWTARRSNQSILKEISPGISLEGIHHHV